MGLLLGGGGSRDFRVRTRGSNFSRSLGYSFLASQFGLGIDSIVSFNVVRPEGSIVTASATSNPDLFFALKGGRNNFVSLIYPPSNFVVV